MKFFLFTLLALTFSFCSTTKPLSVYASENIKVERLSKSTFRHISYLDTETWGKVGCNGMVVINDGEALIFDTPTRNEDSAELIDWVEQTYSCKVTGIVVTHFHNDCLGGLEAFHQRGIPSYASAKTIAFAKGENYTLPETSFDESLELSVGNEVVINRYFGEGHTKDNVVSYYPSEKVLFGGCLVKKVNAGKGYLGDANVSEWSNTVRALRSQYQDVKVVVPGHGSTGGKELLDYTIGLFEGG